MISLASANGRLLRTIPALKEEIVYGYHRRFGFVSERTALARRENRKRFGLQGCRHCENPVHQDDVKEDSGWLCQFRLLPKGKEDFEVISRENCDVSCEKGIWWIKTPKLSFQLSGGDSSFAPLAVTSDKKEGNKVIPSVSLLLTAMILVGIFFPQQGEDVLEEVKKEEPIIVKVVKPKRIKTVTVPRVLSGVKKFAKNQKAENRVRRAVKQNLGFLGILGEKGLRKALGGTPSRLKNASPGAGPGGGTGGSGGELLVGLGKGIRKTTVGNTGTVGLGGIGTKGKGGGLGGYGNAVVSSGVGGSLNNIPLGKGVVMEGGLSEAVIQATIAKYLSQVRACYEVGLRKRPGLAGTVATRFEIGPSGRLNYSKVSRSTLDNSQVEDCIVRNMKEWQFPRPEGEYE